ncbi:V-set and immunoglobulin domain-containing protein 2 isoform 3-T3 [Rhynchonycteris naso]
MEERGVSLLEGAGLSPYLLSDSQSRPYPAPGGCPVGTAFLSWTWTGTQDQRRQDMAMARLLGSLFCRSLLGLIYWTAPVLAVEVHVPAEPLSTPVGKTAELACSYSTSVTDNFVLEWSFVQPGKPISASHPILYFSNGHLYPTGSKAKRASLLQNPPTGGVATLKLTDVHPSDTGTYICHVNNPPDFYTNGLGLINLTVLVPPSSPLCSQTGQISLGGSATLRCSSSSGAPRPVYNWVHLGSSPTPSPGSMVQDDVSGQLILNNLSLASSGTYRCVATNQMGSASCELTFSVTDAIAPGISEQISLRADSNNGLLEKSPSASTVKTNNSKLPMVV